MTVYDRVAHDMAAIGPVVIYERPPAPCAICGVETYLRYGCCLGCAKRTSADDPRLTDYPRVGDKDPAP